MMNKILFVSRAFPADFKTATHGSYKRMRTFLEAIQRVAETVDILFYVPIGADISSSAAVAAEENLAKFWSVKAKVSFAHMADNLQSSWVTLYLAPVTSFFKQPDYSRVSGAAQVAAFEKCLAKNPDAIFFHRLQSVCPALLTQKKLPPVFFDLDDIEHVKFFRELKQPPFWIGKLFYYLHIPALMLGERRAIRMAKKTFVCSELDRHYLSRLFSVHSVESIANSVAIPDRISDTVTSRKLLFIGTFIYPPNIAAAEFLIDRVWPLVRRSVPDARLLIVGNRPENIPSYQAQPEGVEFSGFLSSLHEAYGNTQVVCCPVLSGGGTRVKIIEAAAYGKVVVSTIVGAEGLEFQDGHEIILRDGETGFADACIQLLKDPARCSELGSRAREKTISLYDREQIISAITEHLESISD